MYSMPCTACTWRAAKLACFAAKEEQKGSPRTRQLGIGVEGQGCIDSEAQPGPARASRGRTPFESGANRVQSVRDSVSYTGLHPFNVAYVE